MARLLADGTWRVYNTSNSKLPSDFVQVIQSDNAGGLWVGTYLGGLLHWAADGSRAIYDKDNAGLPSNHILALEDDGKDGLWLGTDGGLARVSFPQVEAAGSAAILIAGGGNNTQRNKIWDTTEKVANQVYNTLSNRHMPNSLIYYLSPMGWADFNGDGYDDRIVDAPSPSRQLAVQDVRDAFSWVKSKGQMEMPLYVFLIDHGGEDRFALDINKGVYLLSSELKALLDDYQASTGNAVIVVIDACHSGAQIPLLANTQYRRAVITSTDGGLAYFDNASRQSFMGFLAKGLLQGRNFKEAFYFARDMLQVLLPQTQADVGTTLNKDVTQDPQLEDTGDGQYVPGTDGAWLQTQWLNTSLAQADITLTVQALITKTSITAGQSITLKARAALAQGRVKSVWAVVRPPAMPLQLDTSGTPILAYPRVELAPTDDPTVWERSWKDSAYNGDYLVTFYAKGNEVNIENSETVVISVSGGIDPPQQQAAGVQVSANQSTYRAGQRLSLNLSEINGAGYDLYAAVVLPDGNFFTFTGPNQLGPANTPDPWRATRAPGRTLSVLDLDLPALPVGQYCFYGILSPAGGNVLNDAARWVTGQACVTIQ